MVEDAIYDIKTDFSARFVGLFVIYYVIFHFHHMTIKSLPGLVSSFYVFVSLIHQFYVFW